MQYNCDFNPVFIIIITFLLYIWARITHYLINKKSTKSQPQACSGLTYLNVFTLNIFVTDYGIDHPDSWHQGWNKLVSLHELHRWELLQVRSDRSHHCRHYCFHCRVLRLLWRCQREPLHDNNGEFLYNTNPSRIGRLNRRGEHRTAFCS